MSGTGEIVTPHQHDGAMTSTDLPPDLRNLRVAVARWALANGRPLNRTAITIILGTSRRREPPVAPNGASASTTFLCSSTRWCPGTAAPRASTHRRTWPSRCGPTWRSWPTRPPSRVWPPARHTRFVSSRLSPRWASSIVTAERPGPAMIASHRCDGLAVALGPVIPQVLPGLVRAAQAARSRHSAGRAQAGIS